jgi:hypothetical protein
MLKNFDNSFYSRDYTEREYIEKFFNELIPLEHSKPFKFESLKDTFCCDFQVLHARFTRLYKAFKAEKLVDGVKS